MVTALCAKRAFASLRGLSKGGSILLHPEANFCLKSANSGEAAMMVRAYLPHMNSSASLVGHGPSLDSEALFTVAPRDASPVAVDELSSLPFFRGLSPE